MKFSKRTPPVVRLLICTALLITLMGQVVLAAPAGEKVPAITILSSLPEANMVNYEMSQEAVEELRKLGADISTQGKTAVVSGVERLHGADLCCTDLRGGAAVVLGAMAAEGASTVRELSHIDRGYERFAENLTQLGVDIKEE